MKRHLLLLLAFALASSQPAALLRAQTQTRGPNSPAATTIGGAHAAASGRATATAQTTTSQRAGAIDLTDYGVRIAPEPRLIVMMAALEAVGLEQTPAGRTPTEFRQQVRKDLAGLDPELQARMRRFYELNKLKDASATPAQQAARYVSLAFALGPAPQFEAPARSDDIFAGVLEVLDFAPLVREFYRQSGIAERLPGYVRDYQAEGDRQRKQAAEMLSTVLSYLHTRPQTITVERVPVSNPSAQKGKKKDAPQVFTTRERDRRFVIVPDLLAAPGAVNFRVVGEDYYVIVPFGIGLNSSEVRRAYLQYVIEPLVRRHNRDIALRRADLRQLIDARFKPAPDAPTPGIFDLISRSLVAAADARLNAAAKLQDSTRRTTARLQAQTPEAERARVAQEVQAERAAIEDELTAQLADAYERGALLSFYFSEQLRDQEIAGFDVANFFTDMIARIDPARELKRPEEYAAARERALAARRARQTQAAAGNIANTDDEEGPEAERREALIKQLDAANELLRLKKYDEAEARLKALMREYQGEPRVFFALAQIASSSAEAAFDEQLRDQRLGLALANYRFAIQSASPDTDRALLSRAHTGMGRILAFQDRNDEALKAFDAAIALGEVAGGAYNEALTGKSRLTGQP